MSDSLYSCDMLYMKKEILEADATYLYNFGLKSLTVQQKIMKSCDLFGKCPLL